jgi:hypothetical protein
METMVGGGAHFRITDVRCVGERPGCDHLPAHDVSQVRSESSGCSRPANGMAVNTSEGLKGGAPLGDRWIVHGRLPLIHDPTHRNRLSGAPQPGSACGVLGAAILGPRDRQMSAYSHSSVTSITFHAGAGAVGHAEFEVYLTRFVSKLMPTSQKGAYCEYC